MVNHIVPAIINPYQLGKSEIVTISNKTISKKLSILNRVHLILMYSFFFTHVRRMSVLSNWRVSEVRQSTGKPG